jgi:hypothetical protein
MNAPKLPTQSTVQNVHVLVRNYVIIKLLNHFCEPLAITWRGGEEESGLFSKKTSASKHIIMRHIFLKPVAFIKHCNTFELPKLELSKLELISLKLNSSKKDYSYFLILI